MYIQNVYIILYATTGGVRAWGAGRAHKVAPRPLENITVTDIYFNNSIMKRYYRKFIDL